MQVKELLNQKGRDVIVTTPQATIEEVMGLLIDRKISCLPVMDGTNRLVGIISDKDIFRRVYTDKAEYLSRSVSDLMTTDVIVGVPEDGLGYIAGLMTQNRIRHVPIVEGEQVVGLISVGDIVKTQMENIKIENRYLKQYIEGSYPG
jgi:CBS domain-containing protein